MKAVTIWERIVPLLLFWMSELWQRRWQVVIAVLAAAGISIAIAKWLTVWLGIWGFFVLISLHFRLLLRQAFQFVRRVQKFCKIADAPVNG